MANRIAGCINSILSYRFRNTYPGIQFGVIFESILTPVCVKKIRVAYINVTCNDLFTVFEYLLEGRLSKYRRKIPHDYVHITMEQFRDKNILLAKIMRLSVFKASFSF